jgi:hypothetical protein
MPLITTDAPPMNEHQPLATIPASREAMYLTRELCIPVSAMDAADLAGVLQSLHGRPIGAASEKARAFVESEHCWSTGHAKIRKALEAVARTI